MKIEIYPNNNELYANYYMGDHSIRKLKVEKLGKYELKIGSIYLNKQNYCDSINDLEQEIFKSKICKIFNLSDKTMLIRIPSFSGSQKSQIDRVVKRNMQKITSCQNLIIDLRNNGGGIDKSYSSLIPIIYTNPITTHGVEFLSTSLNNAYLEKLSSKSFLARLISKKYLKKLNDSIGKFVNISDKRLKIKVLKNINDYPNKIYVLINEGCASATEEFLLAANQSTKVRMYGKRTAGALDFAEVAEAYSPDSCIRLFYSLARTLRSVNEWIEGVGIEPDVTIPDSISTYDWIKFIKEEIEKD